MNSPKPNKPNPNRPGGAGASHPGGKPRPPHGKPGNRPPGRPGQPRGKKSRRPGMDSLIRSVSRGTSKQGPAMKASAPPVPSELDDRNTGMLYPASQFQERPGHVSDKQHKLRVIPLGGLEEVGMNCMAIEYGDDIVVIDVGWMFPDETMPGIDYVLPDTSYLEKKQKHIRGVLITHAHLDHIGAAPYILPKMGYPKVYATQFARALMEGPLKEHKQLDRVQFQNVKYADKLRIGVFEVEFFHVNHNIPEGMGIAVHTPVGTIVHTGDFKFDATPVADEPAHLDRIKEIGNRGVVLAMCDSTNVERPGHTPSEMEIGQNLQRQILEARGRVIMSTFSSLISRLQQAITAAEQAGRKVTIVGRSMLQNVEICQRLGYLDIPKDILIDSRSIGRYRDNQLLILCTGSQANEMSALVRMATGEHKQIQIKQGDTVIVSSSPIPGNERAVELMMDDLFRRGADVLYSKILDIHTSGHAFQDELKQMLEMLKPRHFMPIHGEFRKRVLHGRLAGTVGVPADRVHLLDNGRVLELNHAGEAAMIKDKVGGNLVFVDGLGVGDVGQVVLRDRKHMAEDGMFVIICRVERRSGKLSGSPDIISRGFIYLRESGDLLQQVRAEVRKLFQTNQAGKSGGKTTEPNYFRNRLRDEIGDFLYAKTQRRPMVLPVILEV